MKIYAGLTLILALLSSTVMGQAVQLPLGTHEYTALVQGVPVGKMIITSEATKSGYKYWSTTTIKFGAVEVVEKQYILESQNFAPIYYEKELLQCVQGQSQNIKITVQVVEGQATIKANGATSTVKLAKDVHFDGGYVTYCLLRQGLRAGVVVNDKILLPSTSVQPLKATFEVVGEVTIRVGQVKRKLFKLKGQMGPIQSTIYMNAQAVPQRIDINTGMQPISFIIKR